MRKAAGVGFGRSHLPSELPFWELSKGHMDYVGMVAESYFFGFVGGHIVTGGSNYCSQHLDGYLLLVKYNLLLNTMSDMDGARRWKA